MSHVNFVTVFQAFTYLAIFGSIQGKLMLSTIAVKHFSELKVTANRFQVSTWLVFS